MQTAGVLPAPTAPTAPTTQSQFPLWVRSWVHYDNLVNNYNKQATAARKMRDLNETYIIQNLRNNNLVNARIQITGGVLTVAEESSVPSLTLPRIEEFLHAYYKQKGNHMDETADILRFIKQQRLEHTSKSIKLKKTITASVPSVPPLQPQLR